MDCAGASDVQASVLEGSGQNELSNAPAGLIGTKVSVCSRPISS